jgi:serine/threonine protein kinase
MVHRDIKPGNIILDDVHKRVLLADFGLVKSLEDAVALESTDTVVGTANYVSPEQGNAEPVDARSDLYSFGVVLYEMLAGKVPFKGSTSSMTILKHVHEPPPRLAKIAPQIPRPLTAVVDKLLAKHPDERYQTVDEVVAAVKSLPGERIWPVLKGDPHSPSAGVEEPIDLRASPSRSVVTAARGLAARLRIVIRRSGSGVG